MRAWTEAEIDSDIFRHDARNLQLKRRPAERGIDFRGERPITCNFRAPSQRQAFPCSVGRFSYLARSSTGPTPRPSLEPRSYGRDGPVCSRVVMCLRWLVHRYLTSAT
jgi:hypothetical protein